MFGGLEDDLEGSTSTIRAQGDQKSFQPLSLGKSLTKGSIPGCRPPMQSRKKPTLSRFGHPDLTNFGQTKFGQFIFGHRGFGPANFGQNQFWPKPILANPILANPIFLAYFECHGGAPFWLKPFLFEPLLFARRGQDWCKTRPFKFNEQFTCSAASCSFHTMP